MSTTTTIESQQQNLSALQRLDNKIFSVLGTSTHVTAYRFDESVKTWFRKDIEGSLFIVNRTEYPYCKLIVMNRLSTKNLVEEISEKIIIRCQGPYLIYKNRSEEINGIWFYELSDQEKIYTLLKEVQKQPPQPPQQQQVQQVQQPPVQQVQQQQLPPQQVQQHQQQVQQQQPNGTMSPSGMIPPPGFIMTPNGLIHPPQYMQNYPPQYMMHQQPPPQQQQQQYINPSTPNKQQPPMQHQIQQQQQPVQQSLNDNIITPQSLLQQQQIPSKSPTLTPQQPLSPTPQIKKEVPLLSVLMNSVVIKENNSSTNNNNNTVTKDQIRESLKRLVNDEKFIDLVYNSYINEQ